MVGTRGRGGGRGHLLRSNRGNNRDTTPIVTSEVPKNQLPMEMPNLTTELPHTPDFQTVNEVYENLDQGSAIQEKGSRGKYLSKNIPTTAAERKVIRIGRSNYLDTKVPRSITKQYKGAFRGKHTEWHLLDKILVEHLYKRFQDLYQYEENVDLDWAREIWEERSKTLCRQTWNQVRTHCKKESESTNPIDWKPYRPDFVHEEDWEGILESWMTPKWQKMSEDGTKNRKRVPGDDEGASSFVKHTGGSINFDIHLERMKDELGYEPNKIHFFGKLHKTNKGKGEWCDARAEKAVEKYEEKMKEKYPSDGDEEISEQPFDPKAWLEVTSISKKKDAYGFGQTEEAENILSQTRSSPCVKKSRPHILTETQIEEEITTRVALQVDLLRVDMKAEMTTEMNAKEEKMRADMQETMRQMLQNYHRA